MPSSQHYHISKILDLIIGINPKSVLDIGAGFGKYGFLCREYLELWDGRESYSKFMRRIDGVEVFRDYITPVHEFVYDHIYIDNILDTIKKIDFSYDLVLLIDVLEHFEKKDGEILLQHIFAKHSGLLLSTPKNPSPQKNAFGNIHETHKSRWKRGDFGRYGSTYFVKDRVSHIVYIGKKENLNALKKKMVSNKLKSIPGLSSLLNLAELIMNGRT